MESAMTDPNPENVVPAIVEPQEPEALDISDVEPDPVALEHDGHRDNAVGPDADE